MAPAGRQRLPGTVLTVVSLRPISASNREAVEALEVSPAQEQFVSNVADSLLEAAAEPDGRALYWAVYSDETPVGFVMISDEVGGPGYIPHYLWKLFIDERYQRQGFGTATLDLIVEYFRGRPGVEVLSTSAGQGEGSPITFYEHYGFEQTGEIVFDDEVLLRLELR
ncbi:MAG: GNAT family N-acetyltransferase [Actinomycetota bacterium]